MIFGARMRGQILAGKKTQTRRVVRSPELKRRANGTAYTTRPFQPAVGMSVAVQPGRGKEAVFRIHVTGVRSERLGDITFEDARAEGFRSRDEFREHWVRLHDAAWAGAHEDLLARFDERHADAIVWVIEFVCDREEQPRLLAARSQMGYTASPALALAGEPEAVSRADQAVITAQAQARDQELRGDEFVRARRKLERELEKLELFNDARVHDRVRLIRRNLAAIDKLLRDAA